MDNIHYIGKKMDREMDRKNNFCLTLDSSITFGLLEISHLFDDSDILHNNSEDFSAPSINHPEIYGFYFTQRENQRVKNMTLDQVRVRVKRED